MLRLQIDNDPDTSSPDDGGWKMVSFYDKHINSEDREDYFGVKLVEDRVQYCVPNIGLRRKLQVGTAFTLDYFEHGECSWRIGSDDYPQGLLLWLHPPSHMGARDLEGRTADATAFLESYTDWCNGRCFWYSLTRIMSCPTCNNIDDGLDEDIDSCGGYIGSDHMLDEIKGLLDEFPDESVTVTGEASWIGDGLERSARPKLRKVIKPKRRVATKRRRLITA